jgi:hypothetical protein
MKEIDEFLEFLMKNESDERISISKKMKFGYRNYYVNFYIDDEPEDKSKNQNQGYATLRAYRIQDSIDIVIDNRNKCIELTYDSGSSNIIVEDEELINKWNVILEEYISRDLSSKTKDVIEKALSDCYKKDLHRQYQMKKILPDDESI